MTTNGPVDRDAHSAGVAGAGDPCVSIEIPGDVVSGRGGVAVVLALLLANLSNYSFQVVTGRALSVEEYGLLGGFMASITIITVSTSALQTTSARAIAAGENDASRSGRWDGLTRSAVVGSVVVGVVIAAVSPLGTKLLHVGVLPVVVLAAYVLPASLDSIASGRLQGMRRFRLMAAYSAGQAVMKLAVTSIVLVLGVGVTGLLGAVVLSSGAVAIVGLSASRGAGAVDTHALGRDARRAFAALTLFWVIVSIDVPLARSNFDEVDAGIYTAAAVLGKAVLWVPTMVAQIVFPTLAGRFAGGRDVRDLLLRTTLLVLAIAGASVGALAVFGESVYGALYGDRYAGAAAIAWRLGLAMVPWALFNLFLFHQLARNDGRFVGWLVGALVIEVGALQLVPADATSYALVLGVVGVAMVLAMLLGIRSSLASGDTLDVTDVAPQRPRR